MTQKQYPILTRYPVDLNAFSPAGQLDAHLVESLQELARIEHEFVAAQHVISAIDLHALALAHYTVATADLMKLMSGWSPELEAFDRVRRQKYLETMHEIVAQAHAKILAKLNT